MEVEQRVFHDNRARLWIGGCRAEALQVWEGQVGSLGSEGFGGLYVLLENRKVLSSDKQNRVKGGYSLVLVLQHPSHLFALPSFMAFPF